MTCLVLQNREFNGWAETLYQRVRQGYDTEGRSPLSRGESQLFVVFDLEKKPNALKDSSIMRKFGSDGRIYVFKNFDVSYLPDSPLSRADTVRALGGPHRELQVHLMNELCPQLPLDLSSDSGEPPSVQYRANVQQIVDIALSQSRPFRLNTLDVRLDSGPLVPSPGPWFHQAQESYLWTSGTAFCPVEHPFQQRLTSWGLYSTGHTVHSMHPDSNGLCTHVATNGAKVWIGVVDQSGCMLDKNDDPANFFMRNSSLNFDNVHEDAPLGSTQWKLEAYVQRPQELMYVLSCVHLPES
jgi:hypothetical protein